MRCCSASHRARATTRRSGCSPCARWMPRAGSRRGSCSAPMRARAGSRRRDRDARTRAGWSATTSASASELRRSCPEAAGDGPRGALLMSAMTIDGAHYGELLDDLSRSVDELVAMVERNPELWTRARPGKWTGGQHAEHVAKALEVCLPPFADRLREL